MHNIIETNEEIILSFGKDFLPIADSLVERVKQMRIDINAEEKRDFARIRIIDHDLDSEAQIVPLAANELIIRIKGEMKLYRQYDRIIEDTIVKEIVSQLKDIVVGNLSKIKVSY